jgi:hypothetical protein
MNLCDACRHLTLNPLRSSVPAHLQRYHAGELSFGFVSVTIYECLQCESLWRWRIAEGWERADALEAVIKPVGISPPLDQPYA